MFSCSFSSCLYPTVQKNTIRSKKIEIAINPPEPRSPFFNFDLPSAFKNSELEDKLKHLNISDQTIELLTNHIENESNEHHKNVLIKNVEWYACACDAISKRLGKNTKEHTIEHTMDNSSCSDWLNNINQYFESHKHPKMNPLFEEKLFEKKLFEENYKIFKNFYQRFKSQDGSDNTRNWETKPVLMHEGMNEEILNTILDTISKWNGTICKNFNSPLDLIRHTNYKELRIFFSITTPSSTGGKTIIYYIYYQHLSNLFALSI